MIHNQKNKILFKLFQLLMIKLIQIYPLYNLNKIVIQYKIKKFYYKMVKFMKVNY